MGAQATGDLTFYQTKKTTQIADAAWLDPLGSDPADGNAFKTERGLQVGSMWGACKAADAILAAGIKNCRTLVNPLATDGLNTGALKSSFVKGRFGLIGANGVTEAETTLTGGNAAASASTKIDDLKSPGLNKDFILGTFYQSNGNLADATTWCSVSTGSDDAAKEKFMTVIDKAGTVASFEAGDTFGPKAKCTWQVMVAADG